MRSGISMMSPSSRGATADKSWPLRRKLFCAAGTPALSTHVEARGSQASVACAGWMPVLAICRSAFGALPIVVEVLSSAKARRSPLKQRVMCPFMRRGEGAHHHPTLGPAARFCLRAFVKSRYAFLMPLRTVALMLLQMAAGCRPTPDPAGDLYYD